MAREYSDRSRGRRALQALPSILAILFVLAAYAFFASHGTFDFPRVTDWKVSNYASLAQGFMNGHLYLDMPVDSRLAVLPYPWDIAARRGVYYLWDVSFFNGRYYLYFTALPVVLIYLPFRAIFRTFPADSLVVALLMSWAFLASVAFARRALMRSVAKPLLPLPLWIVFIGIGGIVPFCITHSKMYEIAIVSGTAMTAMWALALLEFNHTPTLPRLAWVTLWLALAIASRPNLGMLLFLTAYVAGRHVWKERRAVVKTAIAFLAPLAIVGLLVAWYNYTRFNHPLESGHRYQLTTVSMEHYRVCGLCGKQQFMRLVNHSMHYVAWPPKFVGEFPYVWAENADLDRAVAWPTGSDATEQVIGIAPVMPLTIAGTLAALLLAFGLGRGDPASRAAVQVMAGGWLVLFGLATCWWVVARYSLDFLFLIVMASVVCIELLAARLRELGLRVLPMRAAVALLAIYSIIVGLLLGFTGPGGQFLQKNRELFDTFARWLS